MRDTDELVEEVAEGGELMEDNGEREERESDGEGAVVSSVPGPTTTVTMPAWAAAVSSMSREPGKYVLCSRDS